MDWLKTSGAPAMIGGGTALSFASNSAAANATRLMAQRRQQAAEFAAQQDPARTLSAKLSKAIDFVINKMNMIKNEAQNRGLLSKGQLRANYVPHEYDFDEYFGYK